MTSKLVVNTIEADTGISSVSFASSISMDSTSKFHFSAAGVDIGADTNINRPAAGVLGFNINGAEKVRIDSSGHMHGVGVVTATHFYGNGANLTSLPAANITGTLPAISGANLTNLPAQATIANNADNRVITGGSGVNLNGEANLTFDGNTFSVTTGTGVQHPFNFRNDFTPNAYRSDLLSTGNLTSNNSLRIGTVASSGGVTLQGNRTNDSAAKVNLILNPDGGDVGIGTVSPQSAGLTVVKHSEARLQVWANGDGSNGKIALRADGTNTQMGTWSNHDCHLVRNSSIQATISSTGISLPAGKGIDFSATSDATGMTSELFDDYERGAHTFTVTGAGGNPTVNIASGYNKLYYTKIGGMVHVTGELRWTISSHGSGDLRISIPFTADSQAQSNCQGTAQTWNVDWAWRTESRDLWSEVSPGHNYMRFRIGGSDSLNEDYLDCGSAYQKQPASGYGVEYQVSLWYRTG